MWLGQMKIFRSMLCTLCQKIVIIIKMQLCGFHCITWYSICILVIVPKYFFFILMHHCLGPHVDISSSYYHSFYIKCSSQSCVFFTFLSNLTIFIDLLWLVMTHAIPIQCNAFSYHNCLAQCIIYHFSSVEAYLLWKCCWVCSNIMGSFTITIMTLEWQEM